MSGDRRRSPRTDVDLRVEIQPDGRPLVLHLRAVDVNEHGLFIGTSEPLALHTPVRLRVLLGDGRSATLHGRVVRILWADRVAPGEQPGFGVQLDVLDGETQAAWNAFCRQIAAHRTPAPERRRFGRVPLRIEAHVHAENVADLSAFVLHDLSASGAGFLTDAQMPSGTRLLLALHHPQTDEIFRLEAEVVRCEAVSVGFKVGVRFDAPELQAFVRLTAPAG
jgi:hypothetical protein